MKLARAAHQEAQFEKAKGYYETGIDCLLEMPEADRDEIILASAHVNLTSCLTMLHRYEEAEQTWHTAQQFPLQPGADATAAILYAAMGNEDMTARHIERLKKRIRHGWNKPGK